MLLVPALSSSCETQLEEPYMVFFSVHTAYQNDLFFFILASNVENIALCAIPAL